MSIRAYYCVCTQAYEHLSIKVHIPLTTPLPQHSSTIIKAFVRMNVQLHVHLSIQAYSQIIIQVCTRVWISNM